MNTTTKFPSLPKPLLASGLFAAAFFLCPVGVGQDLLGELKLAPPNSEAGQELLQVIDPANIVSPEERYTVIRYDGPEVRPALYEKRAFDEVEKMLQQYWEMPLTDFPSPMYAYAVWSLAEIRDDIDADEQRAVLDEWCEASDSHLPWLVRGSFNNSDAFRIRGTGWASEVPEAAWPEFYKRIEWMEQDLLRAAEKNAEDPQVFASLVACDTSKGNPRETMEKHFKAATDLDPAYYPAWTAKARYLLPRWHGTPESAREHAMEADKLAEDYPWLHHVTLDYMENLKQSAPDSFEWSEPNMYAWIKSAFESRLSRHPESAYLKQAYALYAYRAEDWELTAELMDEVGDRYTDASGWASVESYNSFRAKAYMKLARLKSSDKDLALQLATKALRTAPEDYQVVYEVAYMARAITKDFAASLALLEHSVRLNPEYAPTRWLLAADLAELGRYEDAIEAAETALPLARNDRMRERIEHILSFAQRRLARQSDR